MNRIPRLWFVACLLVPGGARAQAFDWSGVDAFWPVYESLRAGAEPAREQWERMFATPGYAALEARERRRGPLELAMRLAFAPGRLADRDSVLRTNGFHARAVRHLMGIPAARDSIERFRATLDRSGVLEAARRRVAAFVPRGLTDSVAPPPVALVFFLDDGRGYPTVIVGDALRLARAGADTGYFAHEFYHAYRRRITVAYREHAPADAGVEELLAYPAEEGMADQLDKREYAELDDEAFAQWMSRPGAPAYAPEYRANYERADEWMLIVTRTLERVASRPDFGTAIARAARDSLPDSGRPLGAFMARTIDRVLGRDALVAAGRDQYAFWLEYDRAVSMALARDPSRRALPRLSSAALGVVQRLAARYRP